MLTRLAGAAGTAAVLVALLTSCSGAAPAAPGPAAPVPDASAQAADAVRATFTGYTKALLDRDFVGACAALTDQAAKALVADINTKNIPARTCDQAYAALYSTEAAQKLDESNRTVRVTDVTVEGGTASLTYTGTVGGRPVPPQTIRVEQVEGRWRIAPAG